MLLSRFKNIIILFLNINMNNHLSSLQSLVINILTLYVKEVNTYINSIKTNPKKNRLEFISDFMNTITLKIIEKTNELLFIKNIVLPDSDISIHKNGHITMTIKIIDSIDNMKNCTDFGCIISVIDKNSIIMAAALKFSYLTELLISKKGETELFYFNKKAFKKISKVTIPKKGNNYLVDEGKQKSWTNYHIRQFLEKIKLDHTLIYSKSLVESFFHIMNNGGVFISPADQDNINGTIELVFEAIPLSFILTNSGGIAKNSIKPILDIEIPNTKKKYKLMTSFIAGSVHELNKFKDVINPSLVFFE